jgi:hypothetical protein
MTPTLPAVDTASRAAAMSRNATSVCASAFSSRPLAMSSGV